jgi:Domain of Unknown Function (DUF1206)
VTVSGTARQAAGSAGQQDLLEHAARVGLLAYGALHLIVAWLALQLAWGGGGGETDQSGAFATVARSGVGRALLWVVAVGLCALAVWQAAEVLRWRSGWSASGKQRTKAVRKSVKAVAKAVVYLTLAVLAVRFAVGSGRSSAQSQQQHTAGVFGWPGGRVLVAAVGVVVIAVGVQQVWSGLSGHFRNQVDLAEAPPRTARVVIRLGQVGFPAKGIALVLVGGLLGWAAITFDAAKASGLDGALHTVLAAPGGQVLLTLVALGIAAFGAFSLARARYPERT